MKKILLILCSTLAFTHVSPFEWRAKVEQAKAKGMQLGRKAKEKAQIGLGKAQAKYEGWQEERKLKKQTAEQQTIERLLTENTELRNKLAEVNARLTAIQEAPRGALLSR